MRFDINNYKGSYAMHCKTEAEAKEFCDYLHSIGKKWVTKASYANTTHWNKDTKEIYYFFNEGTYSKEKSLWITNSNCTVLEWSDFTTEFTKADIKDGMIVEYNQKVGGTNRRLVIDKFLVGADGSALLSDFKDDLTGFGILVINKVYKCTPCGYPFPTLKDIFNNENLTLIWERKAKPEPVEMTIEEICKALGKEIKIVKG